MTKNTNKKRIYRYFGNFGTSFFGPLTSGNIASQLFNFDVTFIETIVISAISSAFTLGLLASQELKSKGE